ncbi:hypothetical protein OSB04_014182 [Centaurea solstitialis]|uniref:Uncharacterized protein n=1 Tax=Centaurea solstitialis TaxID=347529 RepID=A0AA38TEY5_9ASTR|nr:hypothetical protein OSB04_014182 [Centaurea solstitialis]
MPMSPVCDRRGVRARSRHIFLQGYKLSMYTTTKGKLRRSNNDHMKLKKAMVKVKTMVVSVLSFMRAGSLKRCNSKSAIAASSPNRVQRCF